MPKIDFSIDESVIVELLISYAISIYPRRIYFPMQEIDEYDKLDDTLEFEDLLEQLGEIYGVWIGDIYDITEF